MSMSSGSVIESLDLLVYLQRHKSSLFTEFDIVYKT